MAALTHLVGNPDLAKGRLLQRQLDDDRLDLGRRAVRQQRLASRELLKGDFAPDLIQLLEAVEAVARVAHHLARLADVAELLRKFQQANFGPNDLLLLRHRPCPLERRGRALRTPTTPRPASAHASASRHCLSDQVLTTAVHGPPSVLVPGAIPAQPKADAGASTIRSPQSLTSP